MRQYLQPAIFGFVAAVIVALSGLTVWQFRSASRLRQEAEQARQDLAAAVTANAGTNAALDSCVAANSTIMDGLRADLEAARKSADGARAEAERLRRSVDDERRRRSDVYASDPEAAAWGRTVVPERIADGMRR